MKRINSYVAVLIILAFVSIGTAQKTITYGRCVSTRSTYTGTFNSVFGNIERHDINNNNVSRIGVIYSGGDARNASISPDGNRVAFLRRDNRICIININGTGSVQVLGSITSGATGYIDWPMNEWIYYSPQGITSSGQPGNPNSGLHRINTNTGATQNLGNVGLNGTWRIHVSQNGARAVVTGWGIPNGGWKSRLVELTNNKISRIVERSPCGGSLSPNGSLYTLNGGDHASVQVRRFDNNAQVASWTTGRRSSAGPNWNRQRWSSNSNDWATFTQGGPYQLNDYHNQVLYYVPDNGQTNIQVTNNSRGQYNEGDDLWIGSASVTSVSISSFTAAPETITAGNRATLSWQTSNATGVTLDGRAVALSGTQSVTPNATTAYTLAAQGNGGPVTRRVTVTVERPPQVLINSFTAAPDTLTAGNRATLSWQTSNATGVTLDGKAVALSGTQAVTPNATTAYTLAAQGSGGPVTKKVAITVNAPVSLYDGSAAQAGVFSVQALGRGSMLTISLPGGHFGHSRNLLVFRAADGSLVARAHAGPQEGTVLIPRAGMSAGIYLFRLEDTNGNFELIKHVIW